MNFWMSIHNQAATPHVFRSVRTKVSEHIKVTQTVSAIHLGFKHIVRRNYGMSVWSCNVGWLNWHGAPRLTFQLLHVMSNLWNLYHTCNSETQKLNKDPRTNTLDAQLASNNLNCTTKQITMWAWLIVHELHHSNRESSCCKLIWIQANTQSITQHGWSDWKHCVPHTSVDAYLDNGKVPTK